MAYPFYEKLQQKTTGHSQYLPDEYDYQNYYNYGTLKYDSLAVTARKYKKILPSIEYENERKCPIYIHQISKIPNSSTYNTHPESNGEKRSTSQKKSKPQNSKLLDKLEESYWATWKPSKESKYTKSVHSTRQKPEREMNTLQENVAERLIKYFAVSDFPTSSGSVLEENKAENFNDQFLPISTNTQEIQTDCVLPVTLPDCTEKTDPVPTSKNAHEPEKKLQIQETAPTTNKSQETVIVNLESTTTLTKEEPRQQVQSTAEDQDSAKILKHTDSFIIHRKKQDERKDDVQQPRCIKLYKKTGSTFLKGGSYPLKSCMKKASTEKGNFRLGAPGSPLFVTSSSFNRKYSR